MKTKTIFLSFLMGVLILITTATFAQSVDSVQDSNQEKITQDEQDKQRLQNAVDLRKETRATAKEARASAKEARATAKAADQVEDDAAYAAKEARQAARMEAKAQKNRDHADKQARKAARAIQKSNKN